MIQDNEMLWIDMEGMSVGLCGMDMTTVLKFRQCFIRKYFNTGNTTQFRPAIIQVARQAFFPNLEKIIGGIKYLVNTI